MNDPYNQSYPQQPGGSGGYQQPGNDQKFGGYPPSMQNQPPHVGFVPLVHPQPQPGTSASGGGAIPYNQMPNAYASGYIDPENPLGPEVKGFDFTEQSVRKGFIRKVYSILSCQLFVTLLYVGSLNLNAGARQWMSANPGLLFVAFAVSFVTLIALACVEPLRRRSPLNFIMLGLFTLAESYVVAALTVRFDPKDVFMAVIVTTVVVVGLTMFAFQTKWDFTMMGGILFVCTLLLLLFGLVAMFFKSQLVSMLYASAGAVLFSVYLIYDTQMMMGGDHKQSISPEEYVFAAITLYLDIINIFIYILSIIGSKN